MNLICDDCEHKFSVPSGSGEPSEQVCPQCAGTIIFERFGEVNTQCLDAMKECSACPFDSSCGVR